MKTLVKRIRYFWLYWDEMVTEDICLLPEQEFNDMLEHKWKQIPYYIKNFSWALFKMAWEIN